MRTYRRILATATATLLGVTLPVTAQVRFEVLPEVSYNFGHTTYTMDILEESDGETFGIKSELEFPLDAPMVGVQVRLLGNALGDRPWSITAGVRTNVSDPGGTMYDSDWDYDPATLANTYQFSYTESGVEGRILDFHIDGRYHFTGSGGAALGGMFSFNYQRIDQDVIGFTGWQLDQDSSQFFFTDDRLGIIYEVWYATPQLGLYGLLPTFGGGLIDASVSAGPVWAEDYDDHVLRGKDAVADGYGLGVHSALSIRIPLSQQTAAHRPFIELGGNVRYYSVDGDQTQRWYQDEGQQGTDYYVPAGTEISNLPHDFTSLQYGASIRFGLALGGRR